jgi:hypothetical protein
MIQFPEDLAWVREADGRSRPFDGARLGVSLQAAATVAGVVDLTLIESIVAVAHLYVCDCCPERTTTPPEIVSLVIEMLTMLGMREIARAYEQRGLWTQIRLDQMAAGEDFELGFYNRLNTRLQAAADAELELVQLRGLRACVMRLRGAQRWGASCRTLADEIVEFVRVRVERVRPPRAVALNVEVLE